MENNLFGIQNTPDSQLIVDETGKDFLKTLAKWTQFLSVLGFIACGLAILACLFAALMILVAGSFSEEMEYALGNIPVGFMSFIYFMGAIFYGIYIIPIYYLYNFSTKMKKAIFQNDSQTLTTSFRFLKCHFKFMGIFTIVLMCLYVLALIGLVLFSLSSSFNPY